MVWQSLLQTSSETVVLPWVGERMLRGFGRTFRLDGARPPEHGWHTFVVSGRKVRWQATAEAPFGVLGDIELGYLVADRLVPDAAHVSDNPAKLARQFERVRLLEPGLDRFMRVRAGRAFACGPLVYAGPEFPLGPEDDVLAAFLDRAPSVDHIPGVAPALDGAFRFASWRRSQVERRRQQARERREREDRLRRVRESLGNGRDRRRLAEHDFAEAATAALAVGGAHYLDHRAGYAPDEMVVRFRFLRQRFECTCEAHSLRIVDAGICLVDHVTDERGDRYFTLESLPGVIRQAEREGELVVLRHIN